MTSLLHRAVEGPVADDRASALPAFLLLLAGGVSWGVAEAQRQRCASPSPFFLTNSGGLSVGRYPAGRDWWGGERVVGGVVYV